MRTKQQALIKKVREYIVLVTKANQALRVLSQRGGTTPDEFSAVMEVVCHNLYMNDQSSLMFMYYYLKRDTHMYTRDSRDVLIKEIEKEIGKLDTELMQCERELKLSTQQRSPFAKLLKKSKTLETTEKQEFQNHKQDYEHHSKVFYETVQKIRALRTERNRLLELPVNCLYTKLLEKKEGRDYVMTAARLYKAIMSSMRPPFSFPAPFCRVKMLAPKVIVPNKRVCMVFNDSRGEALDKKLAVSKAADVMTRMYHEAEVNHAFSPVMVVDLWMMNPRCPSVEPTVLTEPLFEKTYQLRGIYTHSPTIKEVAKCYNSDGLGNDAKKIVLDKVRTSMKFDKLKTYLPIERPAEWNITLSYFNEDKSASHPIIFKIAAQSMKVPPVFLVMAQMAYKSEFLRAYKKHQDDAPAKDIKMEEYLKNNNFDSDEFFDFLIGFDDYAQFLSWLDSVFERFIPVYSIAPMDFAQHEENHCIQVMETLRADGFIFGETPCVLCELTEE